MSTLEARGTAICLLSGGIDSAVALWWTKAQGHDLITLEFLFEGRPRGESRAAEALSRSAGAKAHRQVPVPILRPDDRVLPGYLPKRNLVFYALAAALAETERAEAIVGGQLATDGDDFPDASPAYLAEIEKMINVGPQGRGLPRLRLLLPLIKLNKEQAIALGHKLGCPLELTWSCYRDGDAPCGECSSCMERAQAMR